MTMKFGTHPSETATSFLALLSAGAAAFALLTPSGALAQQAGQVAAQVDNGAVETVVVTASRRSESVQYVGGALTALTSSELSQMHAHSFADFANTVPGLSFEANSPTNNLIAIRGVASSTAELGSAVSLYLDDVPLGASTQFGVGFQSFNINLFDMERVEVLNGPQGTLYGANALGGAIKYVTAQPELGVYDAAVEVEGSSTAHGSYNDGLRVMANVPVLGDKVAIRVDGLQEYDSGYAQDPVFGRTDVGADRTYAGRVSLLADISPDIDVRLSVFTQNSAANGVDASLRDFNTHQPVLGTYSQAFAVAQPSDNSLTVYSAVFNWDLHWAKLTSVTGFQYNHGTYDSDVSFFYDTLFYLYAAYYGALPPSFEAPPLLTTPYNLFVDTNTKKVSQEIRIASPDNKNFEWVIGGFYDREVTDETVNLLDNATSNGLLPAPFSTYPFAGYLPSTYREFAGFADATYYFTDRIDLTLGLRYSSQHQFYQSYIYWLPIDGAPYGQLYPYGKPSDQSVVTYQINPRYRLTDDTMVYAKVSSGYRPGGPNFFPPPFPATFQSDTLWNYELGEKSTLLDGKLTADVDVYDIEWQGIQTTENVLGINQLVNAGNARINGVEGTFTYRVLPPLTLNASGAFTEAHLTTPSPVLGVTRSGDRLPLSPRYNFTVSATYTFDIAGDFSGAINASDVWVGDRDSGYAGSASNVLYKLPAYNTVNLNLSVFMPHNIEFDVYAKNVFDTAGQVSASTLNNAFDTPAFQPPVPVTLSQPRTIGVVLKVGLDK
jgi:outer membrane receptor protein involved in Fe transport